MIVGGHITIPSNNAEADQAFFRKVFGLPSIDAGGGYMIHGLPPCEVAIHGGGDEGHTLHLMCADMDEFLEAMTELGIAATEATQQGWGLMTAITLPGGGNLRVYEPRHKHPKQHTVKAAKKAKPAKKSAARKKPAKKAATKKRAKKR